MSFYVSMYTFGNLFWIELKKNVNETYVYYTNMLFLDETQNTAFLLYFTWKDKSKEFAIPSFWLNNSIQGSFLERILRSFFMFEPLMLVTNKEA